MSHLLTLFFQIAKLKKKVINRPLKPWYLYDLRSNLMGFLVVAITLRLKPWQRRIDWMKATSSRREFKSSPFCVGKYGLMIKWLHTKIWLISICEDMDLLRRNMIFAVKKYCRSLIWIPRLAISRRHIVIFSNIKVIRIHLPLRCRNSWISWVKKKGGSFGCQRSSQNHVAEHLRKKIGVWWSWSKGGKLTGMGIKLDAPCVVFLYGLKPEKGWPYSDPYIGGTGYIDETWGGSSNPLSFNNTVFFLRKWVVCY